MNKLIVIEGACDGIGKSTQFSLLKQKLEKNNNIYTHHFPTYDSYQGEGVVNYLKGNFGNIKDLSPYFVNCLYAYDRAVTWYKDFKPKYDNGSIILLDRYTTSSLIYQSALIEDKTKKMEFINYVIDFEYNKLGIKKPDKVIFLTADYEVVKKLREERKENDGVEKDIHETDDVFMKKVYDNANFIANYLNWDIINCSDDNKMKSIDKIQKLIIKKLDI